MINVDHV